MIDQKNVNYFYHYGQEIKQDSKKTYQHAQDDVSQYLNLGDFNYQGHLDDCSQTFTQPLKPLNQLKQNGEQLNQIGKILKKRSSFHNFQKHIVITIRSTIDVSKFGQDPKIAQCQKSIWKAFKKSSKINKTLVSMVVGDLTQQQKGKISEYGFKDIIKQFTHTDIKQAQQNIYLQIMKQLTTVNLQEKLIKRRMKYKKQFIIYFQAFLQQLMKGELDKRMTKCTKLLKNKYL